MSMKIKQSLLLAAVVLTALLTQPYVASAAGMPGSQGLFGQRSAVGTLSFYNTHTRERITVEHRSGGTLIHAAMEQVGRVMRDHRSGQSREMSPRLLDLLVDVQAELIRRHPGKPIEFHIISGYRAPQTNAAMRARGGGQAKNSRHMHGDAVDIRVPGIKTAEVRDIAYCLKRGGVGMYNGSDFVHVDVWNVRTWNWQPTAQTCGGKATS